MAEQSLYNAAQRNCYGSLKIFARENREKHKKKLNKKAAKNL